MGIWETGIWKMNAWDLFVAGGPLMAPLLLCSILSIAVIIERFIYYSSIASNVPKLKNDVFDLVRKNNIKAALERCDKDPSPSAKVIAAGLLKFGASREEIKEAMEDAGLFVIPKLEQKLPILSTIAHLAPLIGLLGTVTGLASCFQTIQERATSLNPVSPGDLAGGIWEALLTTVAGLIVAIVAVIFYNFFVHRVNKSIIHIEHNATELTNFLGHYVASQPFKNQEY